MFAANVDVDYDFGSDSFFRSVSVGARASVRNESDVDTGTYWAPLAQPWAGIKYYLSGDNTPTHTVAPDGSPNDYQLYNFPQYFGGRVPSPGAVLMPSESVMIDRGYAKIVLTDAQRKDYDGIKGGADARRAYIHKLASDPHVLETQREATGR